MNYEKLNDYELLLYVSEKSEEAHEMIFNKYKPLIVDRSNKLYRYCMNYGVEINDLIQEGMVGLNDAINKFDESKDACFYTYALRCINSRIISYIVTTKRLKNKILNDSIFVELNEADQTNGFGKSLADDSYNPEKVLISEENEREILNVINTCLSDSEKEILDLKINGFKYKEIADMIGKDTKYVDNSIQKIKNKIREKLNSKV